MFRTNNKKRKCESMIILLTTLGFILLVCLIVLSRYCHVRKRSVFAFGFFIALLVVVTLIVTGDITVAYAN